MTTSTVPLRRAISGVRAYVRHLWNRREFAFHLALGNVKARNASTTLGLIWWVINPLLLGGIYALVFGVILDIQRGEENYIAYLLAGMFAFYYTRSVMVGAVNSIIQNARLLANLPFPRLVLPGSALIESAVGFVASLGIYYLIVGPIDGVWPGSTVWWLLPAFLLHTLFSFGLGALVARLAVPFRDLNNLVPYVLRLWLYVSPVIWPVTFLENARPGIQQVLEWNPLFPILAVYRHALMGQTLTGGDVVVASTWSVLLFLFGVGLFVRNEGRMTRYI